MVSIAKTIQETLNNILKSFESGVIPEAIAYSVFPAANIPSTDWSFMNRVIMHLSGTIDGRGYRQWQKVNRFVKKGAKAFYILVPRFKKLENEDEILAGFMAKPVFRMEDTDGVPLQYQEIELPELSLIEKAREWGISVKAVPGNYRYFGYFSPHANEIALASKEESVFFHELSHAAHSRLSKDFSKIQSWKKEVVAELSAAALCRIVGKTSRYLGNHYQYIRHYSRKVEITPVKACLNVMSDVESVLNLILADEKPTSDKVPTHTARTASTHTAVM